MDATVRDPFVGHELDNRYEVERRVARGGMATVYVALDRRLGREVALKIMHSHLADDEQFVARFIREARSAAKLSHPNVVQVYDQGSHDGVLYLAMEYLPGRTLREVMAERGSFTPHEALSVLEPVLDALASAHRAGLIHRDVKPENVILTDDGRVKVADFGLARAATGTATSGSLIGTAAYLAPEIVARGAVDTRVDVYAAGVLLFEMLTGKQPFTGEIPIHVAFQHVHDEIPAPSRVVLGLPTHLDELVTTATAQQATPSPRPSEPSPSGRRPLTVTGAPTAAESFSCIEALAGASLGWSVTTEASTLPGSHPASRTRRVASASMATLSAPAHRGSVSEKCSPMSPRPAAPSRASVQAWAITSASLWPRRARSVSKVTPPSTSGRSGSSMKGWTSNP